MTESASAPEIDETAEASAPDRVWPREGDHVRFHPRPGEARQGRLTLPAFILSLDKATGTATVLVFFDADDARTIIRVPEVGDHNSRGWEMIDSDVSLRPVIDGLLGRVEKMDGAFGELIEELQTQMAALTAKVEALMGPTVNNTDTTSGKRKAPGRRK